jgi:hypothetical protein
MYNSNLIGHQNINSVISNGCNLITAFSRVLSYFDPNKGKNYKTKVLDCSYSHMWTDQDLKLFQVDRTKNLTGTVLDKIYDVVVYEPPRNKNFYQDSINSSKVFFNLLKPNGIVIIKINDFKETGSKELKGSFEIWDSFCNVGFYLYDNIIYNFHKSSNNCEVHERAEITHLYFMVFKKK